ncbi:hypothetical protein D3C80_1771100 [compost metagenome]
MAETFTKGDFALPGIIIILPEIRKQRDQWCIEVNDTFLGQRKDARCRENHFGQRGEIEPRIGCHRAPGRNDLRIASRPDSPVAGEIDHSKHPSRNTA